MSRELSVHLLPTLFEPPELQGGTAVVIDVLRASTTIVHALAAGARAVVPCLEVAEARDLAANLPTGKVVLGGEREGKRIEGFDLDNSPLAYTEKSVGGKTVVFTTTNGTRALLRCRQAERVLIGAFSNLDAVTETLVTDERPVHLVCAGTRGRITAEDVLCAGAIAAGVGAAVGDLDRSDDAARMATTFFMACSKEPPLFLNAIRESLGGRDLLDLGLDADVERSAMRNLFELVPEYRPQSAKIIASPGSQ